MDPYDFEDLIARVWKAKGFETSVTDGSHDRGIDIVAEKTGWKEIIQAKRFGEGNKVGSQKVREYATLYQQEPTANVVVIVTSSKFTDAAQKLAEDLRVEIMDGDELIAEIDQYDVNQGLDLVDGQKENKTEEDTETYVSKEFDQKCEHCGQDFSSITRLREHLLNNHKEELYTCEVCGEVFIEKSSVENHEEREHTGKTSSVNYHDKNRDSQNKTQHKGSNKKEPSVQIKCEFCNLSFENDSDYWKHLTDVHDNQLVFCHNCNDHFQSEKSLREHLYQEHDPSNLGRIDQLRINRHLEERTEEQHR
jgi:DNA-directed RNA polymerase subunit M/transcription elongation factor TFIIS